MSQTLMRVRSLVPVTALLLLLTATALGAVTPGDLLRNACQLQEAMPLPDDISPAQRVVVAGHMVSGLVSEDALQAEVQTLLRNLRPNAWMPTSDTAYLWNIDDWQGDARNTYTYGNGKQTLWLTEEWDVDSVKWLNVFQVISTYDGSHRLQTVTYQMWNEGDWVNFGRSVYTYDGSNRVATITGQNWNGVTFADNQRSTMTYGAGDRIATILTEQYAGTWMNFHLETFSYDGNGNQTELLTQNWAGSWVNLNRTTSTYSGNLETESVYQTWGGSTWTNVYRNEYEYSGELQTLDRSSSWVGSAWSPTDVDTLKYTGNLNTETVTYHIGTGVLEKSNYTYDGNDNLILEISQTKAPAEDWVNDSRTVFVYENILAVKVDTDELPRDFQLLQNYPNPFNPSTEIRFSLPKPAHVELVVYNLLGQRVRVLEDATLGPGLYAATWDGTDQLGRPAASGIYFYQIRVGEVVESRKMVLAK